MSDELVKQLTEFKDNFEIMHKSLEKVQEKQDKWDEEKDGLDFEIMKKAASDMTESMAKIQEMDLKFEAAEKTNEYLEKAISRMGGGSDSEEAKELEAKAREEMSLFMKTGREISAETNEAIVRAVVTKSFLGVSEEVREREIKTLIAGSNPDGGYFIRPERSTTMIQRIFETSPIRSHANIETTTGDELEMVIDDQEATSGGWVGEVDSRGETDTPQIGLLKIPMHEQFAQPKATQKMLDDAGFDLESWLSRKVTDKITRTENTAFVLGDGSQKPRGFLALSAWSSAGVYERKALEQINSGVSAQFTGDGVKALQNGLIEDYQPGAIFTIKRASWENIIILKDGNGAYLLDPRSLKDGDTKILLGKQVVFMEDMPTVAADSLSMAYGNFGVGYTIVDRIGFRVLRDPFTAKPFVKFYTTKRTGGDVTNYESIKIQKLAA